MRMIYIVGAVVILMLLAMFAGRRAKLSWTETGVIGFLSFLCSYFTLFIWATMPRYPNEKHPPVMLMIVAGLATLACLSLPFDYVISRWNFNRRLEEAFRGLGRKGD